MSTRESSSRAATPLALSLAPGHPAIESECAPIAYCAGEVNHVRFETIAQQLLLGRQRRERAAVRSTWQSHHRCNYSHTMSAR